MKLQLAVLFLLVAGCAKPIYLNREGRTVLVLPPFNESNSVEAWQKAWPRVEQEMAVRGYNVIPRSTVEAFYSKNKFTVPEEIRQYKPQELAKEFGCDLILRSTITKWGKTSVLLSTHREVAIAGELVDPKDGTVLWQGQGQHSEKSGLLSSADSMAPRAIAACFAKMPRGGMDPEMKPGTQPK